MGNKPMCMSHIFKSMWDLRVSVDLDHIKSGF